MHVLKFGGTSVGSIENIHKVISIVEEVSKDEKTIVVVSAFGGVTDMLIEAGMLAAEGDPEYETHYETIKEKHLQFASKLNIEKNISSSILNNYLNSLEALLKGIYLLNELSSKTIDKLSAYGELCSSLIISEAMQTFGLKATLKNATELIKTERTFGKSSVRFAETNKNIREYFSDNLEKITVVPGFISSNSKNEITTLGRGGSDYTAAIIAAAVEVGELQIWTDVSGMFTANPKLVKHAKPIAHISYGEAMELSHFGAKVLYPPTILPVMEKEIPIRIKNTSSPEDKGTLITKNSELNGEPVRGLSHIGNVAIATLEGSGIVGTPGTSKRFFEALSKEAINIILITQASSEHSICIGIREDDVEKAKEAVDAEFANEIELHKMFPLNVETGLSIIALVGDRMKSHQGISGKMFRSLGKNNVNIRAIAQGASERNISAVIAEKDVKKALNVLHERFFEEQRKQLNLFIAGVGNVGGRLLAQIAAQKEYLKEKLNINIRVVGIANSKKMIFKERGLHLQNWKATLAEGEVGTIEDFQKKAIELNLRNSIFVDITASEAVANSYAKFLKNSIAVVACNKIACSSHYDTYAKLKSLAVQYNAPFLFETNVGAGLPIIDTLNNLMASGDEITEIQAVLSGSLNFVFNNFKKGSSFYEIVKQAQAEGYTEPDPRIDLSGVDVARKILILARESGMKYNLEDVENEPFLTENNLKSDSVDHFFETLKEDASYFDSILEKAEAKKAQLKYVASLKNGKISVGLQEIPPGHPFYNLQGKDNIVLFYSKRYPEQPLIVKGAGAGGDVTASGLFSDIIRMRTY